MDIEIIKATSKQISEVARLNDSVQKIHAEHHPDLFKYPTDSQQVEEFFRDQVGADGNSIFIAIVSGRAVGYVWCAVDRKRENPFNHSRETVYIHQISVDPSYSRKGVGRKLMEAVEELAREQNICTIALDSWEFNSEAHVFFERLGFSRFNVNMWRRMGTDLS